MADEPNDTGLICGHDTSLFDKARHDFEESLSNESRVSEVDV